METERSVGGDRPASPRSAQSDHLPELDGLRGLAILIVIPHNTNRFEEFHGWTTLPAMFANSGWIGVQLFFVLSGFLITKNLLESRDSTNYYRAFYVRRVLRIFPLYYLTLAFFLLLLPRLVSLPPEVTDSYSNEVWFWTFLCNWVQGIGKSIYWFPHFWSLAVEEQFYLVWPLVVAALAERRLQRLCVALVAIAIAVRIGMLDFGATPEMMYRFTFCRMDALAAGAIGAIIVRNPGQAEFVRRYSTTALIASAALLAGGALLSRMYAVVDPGTIKFGYTAISIAMLGVLLVAVLGATTPTVAAVRAFLSNRLLRSVGKYSYAMYIFHLPISIYWNDPLMALVAPAGRAAPLLFSLIIVVVSYAAGFVSYQLIEKRFLALKRHFVPATAPVATVD